MNKHKKIISIASVIIIILITVIFGHIDILVNNKNFDITTIGNIIKSRSIKVLGSTFLIALPIFIIIISYINNKYYELPIIVYLNVGIIALFISFFFFQVIAKEENKILDKQIRFMFNDFIKDIIPYISSDKLDYVKEYIKNTDLPEMSKEDELVSKSNKSLFKNAMFVLGITAAVCFGISLLLSVSQYSYNKIDKIKIFFINILPQALILLIVVAITEFIFLKKIPVNYKSLDPNEIKYFIINFLENETKEYKPNLPSINIENQQQTAAQQIVAQQSQLEAAQLAQLEIAQQAAQLEVGQQAVGQQAAQLEVGQQAVGQQAVGQLEAALQTDVQQTTDQQPSDGLTPEERRNKELFDLYSNPDRI